MTAFLTPLITEEILGSQYARIVQPFRYYSDILGREVEVPTGFICDYESVPLIKGSSKRGGVLHDYFCRKDSDPVVTKQQAASLYLEAQACRDDLLNEGFFQRIWRKMARNFKTVVVRVVPGYFHKLSVSATIDEFV